MFCLYFHTVGSEADSYLSLAKLSPEFGEERKVKWQTFISNQDTCKGTREEVSVGEPCGRQGNSSEKQCQGACYRITLQAFSVIRKLECLSGFYSPFNKYIGKV